MALHLHDNDESADQHLMPFDGSINWDVVMRKLSDIKYEGPTALEITNRGYEHIKAPREFLAIAFETASRLEGLR